MWWLPFSFSFFFQIWHYLTCLQNEPTRVITGEAAATALSGAGISLYVPYRTVFKNDDELLDLAHRDHAALLKHAEQQSRKQDQRDFFRKLRKQIQRLMFARTVLSPLLLICLRVDICMCNWTHLIIVVQSREVSELRIEERRFDLCIKASPNFIPRDDAERDAYDKMKTLSTLRKQETLAKEVWNTLFIPSCNFNIHNICFHFCFTRIKISSRSLPSL